MPTEHNSLQKRFHRERAVAVQYGEGEKLPTVLAQGVGEIARKIVRLAEEHGVPVHEDKPLAELLSKLNVGEVLPDDTYKLLAEVICFLHTIDGQRAAEIGR